MTKKVEFVSAHHIVGKPSLYRNEYCYKCGVNILDYARSTGCKVHVTEAAKRKYRCLKCYKELYSGVLVR